MSTAGRWPDDPPIRGRSEVLAAVSELVRTRKRQRVVLHGDGGYGKSTAAIAIAAEALSRDIEVLWVSAHDRDRLEAGMRTAAARLMRPVDALDTRGALEALDDDWDVAKPADSAWQVFDSAERDWLLVFDNVDDPRVLEPEEDSEDGAWLRQPKTTRGFVLVTTRAYEPRERWGPHHAQSIGPLGDDDGAQMLVDLAGPYADELGGVGGARELSAALRGFPLVISIAGAHLRHAAERQGSARAPDVPVSFRAYLTRFAERRRLDVAAVAEAEPDVRLVRVASELALELLDADAQQRPGTPGARPLLRLLAAMATDPIPVDEIQPSGGDDAVAIGSGSAEIVETAMTLVRMGLLERFAGSAERTALFARQHSADAGAQRAVVLHDRVREVCRAAPDFRERLPAYAAALTSVTGQAVDGLDKEDLTNPRWRGWAAHIVEALSFCVEEAEVPAGSPTLGRAAEAAHRAAWYRHRIGLHHQASKELECVVEVCARYHGPTSPAAIAVTTDLARVTRDREDWNRALELFEEIRRLEASGPSPNDGAVLRTRNRIANVRRLSGNFNDAITEFRDVIRLQQEALSGCEDDDTCTERELDLLSTQHNLALAQRTQAKDEAEKLFKHVLQQRIRLLGEENFETLQTRNQLAVVLRDRGHLQEALDQFRAVEQGRRALLRDEEKDTNRDVLSTRNQMAGALYRLEDFDQAKAIWQDVLAKRRRVLGPNHYLTHVVIQHLGKFSLEAAGREPEHRERHLADAETRLTDLRDRLRTKYGDQAENDQTLGTEALLGRLLFERGQLDEAIARFDEGIPKQEARFGPDHLWTIETVYRRGLAQLAAGRADAAVVDLDRAHRVRRRTMADGAKEVEDAKRALDEARRRAGGR